MSRTRRVLQLLVSTALVVGTIRAGADDPELLRLMSFNIRYGTADDGQNAWPRRRELVTEVIARHDPHLLGIQEALRFQLDELRRELPDYDELGVGRTDGRAAGEYAAILYQPSRLEAIDHGTFWFSDTPERPGSVSWGNRIPRIATWAKFRDRRASDAAEADADEFFVFNVHLDHASQTSRERSVEFLLERVSALRAESPGVPIILMGDFNAGEENSATRSIIEFNRNPESTPDESEIRFADTFRVMHPEVETVGTFNGFQGRSDGPKIDYIFVDAQTVDTVSAGIVRDHSGMNPPRYPSDHYPVIATIRMRD
ncbi:MAG: endonuclease/exonuclease/phosphatase family protein [Phycisphaerales bacterium]